MPPSPPSSTPATSATPPAPDRDEDLAGRLDRMAARRADQPFLIDAAGARTWSYRETTDASRAVAGGLHARGLRRGERLLIVTRNRPETIVLLFAAARLGAIFSIVNPAVKPHGLKLLTDQVEPAMIALDEATAALGAELGAATAIWAGAGSSPFGNGIDLDELMGAAPSAIEDGAAHDPACLILTSGSTGVPRGIMISQDNLRFAAWAIQERLQYRPDDRVGIFLPLAFDYGLYQVFLALEAGASVLVESPESAGPALCAKLADARITVLPVIPTLLSRMLAMLERDRRPLPDLRAITSTGEHFAPALIERTRRRLAGVDVFPMYGLTECKRVSILLPSELAAKDQSVGRPLAGTSVHAIDEDGRRLRPGERGELVVRGRHVAMGYWRAPDETRERFRPVPADDAGEAAAGELELHTGDLGAVDEDGYVYCYGRRGDLFKHRGMRMSPLELESAATGLPGISIAAAVKQERGDRLHLFVTVTDPAVTPASMLARLRTMLEPEKLPDRVHIVPSLPKSPQGKLDRKKILALLEGPEPC